MSLVLNKDYVFCPAATYIGSVGTGKGCLVGTKHFLLGLPQEIHSGIWNHSFTKTTYSLDGKTPGEALKSIAEHEDISVAAFEESLETLSKKCEGAVFVAFNDQKRLKLRTGLCSKGIYWSQRESGPGWKGYGLGSKELCEQWLKFYEDHPLAV